MLKLEGLRVWEIKESHNQFISTRSHKVTWKDSQSTELHTSTRLPRLVNQWGLEAWSRKTQTLTNTPVIRDKVIHKWVPEMDQIISWMASQDNRFLFKKFQSMKICKSLVRIQNSTDMVLSRYMVSETPRLMALSQATRIISSLTNVISSLVALAVIYQESQMKRLLWKQDHPLLSDLQIKARVSIRKTLARIAISSSHSDKSSKIEQTNRTKLCSNHKVASSKSIRRIYRVLSDLEAKRMCSLNVLIIHNWDRQSNKFHRMKSKTSRWIKLPRQTLAQRSSVANVELVRVL